MEQRDMHSNTESTSNIVTLYPTKFQLDNYEFQEETIFEQIKSLERELLNINETIKEKESELEHLFSIEDKTDIDNKKIDELKQDIKQLKIKKKELETKKRKITESGSIAPSPSSLKYGYSAIKGTFKASSRFLKKSAVNFNPLDKPVNKNDTVDTGVEALKLGYRTTKKTYQAGKRATHGVKVLYKAPVRTARIAIGTAKFAASMVLHTAALVLNPIFWIFIVVLLVVAVLIVPIVLILAGGAGGGSTTNKAYGTAAGANKDIATAYPEAEEYYKAAAEAKQNEFNSMIDSLYYSTEDLKHSDLVYMKCSHDNSEYQTSMATNNRKQQLKNKFSNSLSEAEAIALVYVNLEKQKNDENNTSVQIYEVEFTQQAFDDLLNQMISWTETVYSGQECPDKNCSVRYEHNPEWDTAKYNRDMSVNAYNEWAIDIQPLIENNSHIHDGSAQSQDWDNNIGWRIDNWNLVYSELMGNAYTSNYGLDCLADLDRISDYYIDVLNNTPENFQVVDCEHLHNNHAIGLNIISKESVMDSWGFDDNYKQWVELTYQGFLKNPDIQN